MLNTCGSWREFPLKAILFCATAIALSFQGQEAGFAQEKNAERSRSDAGASIPLPGAASEAPAAAPEQNDILDLALKSITLSQGEGGLEIWRLKAAWANMSKQQDNFIQVAQPRLSYFLKDDKIMYVESDRGDVEQKNQVLRFIDNVRITLDEKTLAGPLLVYDGKTKTMTLPRGGKLTDIDLEGSAQQFTWHIDTKVIEAEGDIVIHIAGSSPASKHKFDSAKPVSGDFASQRSE